jgi:hypothetical protein
MAPNTDNSDWIEHLSDEDRVFIKRFLLASGSLKELAKGYKISYPTVRLRLDRLIARIKILDDNRAESDFERQARLMYAAGHFDLGTLKSLVAAYKDAIEVDNARIHEVPDK